VKNLTGRVAAVLTAVSAVALTSPLAVAQEDTVTLEGLVWFDRNANGVVDAGEPPLANGRAVRVFNGKEFIGEYGTDANGRYKVEGLPNTQLSIYNHNTDIYEATTTSSFFPHGGGTFDFGIRGGTVQAFSYVDFNLDGVKSAYEEEVPGDQPLRLTYYGLISGGEPDKGVVMPAPTRGANGEFTFSDVPLGEHVLGADNRWPDLKLAPPLVDHDIDPVTRQKAIVVREAETTRVDARYTYPDADFVAGAAKLVPGKDGYRPGDEVELVVPITNKGEAADKPSFLLLGAVPRVVSTSANVVAVGPAEFALRDLMAVDETVEVRVKFVLDDPEVEQFHLFIDPVSALNHRDVDRKNNHAIVPVTYLPAEPTTTPPTGTTTTTAPPTPTTTSTAVIVAGGRGLANTGAAPLPFLGIGVLLLIGGGALTFLAARRRRRA
jgi:hypothetical protein